MPRGWAANARGWSESAWFLAASGCSAWVDKPAWQHDPNCPGRMVADCIVKLTVRGVRSAQVPTLIPPGACPPIAPRPSGASSVTRYASQVVP